MCQATIVRLVLRRRFSEFLLPWNIHDEQMVT